jgi:acetyltransferase-like isoleucine patch superfamily enzyme/acyl carrier protein
MKPPSLLSQGRRTLELIRTRIALRGPDVVGEDVRIFGRPAIDNRGHLEIGRGTVVCSRPVTARLATGDDGALLIGDGVTIGYGCSIMAEGFISIGEGTRIGTFGTLCDADVDGLSGWRETSRPIVIGSNVRIGSKVTVLPGTYIGDGAEIAPGAVVSGVIPPRALASGVPARLGEPHHVAAGTDVRDRVAQVVADVFSRERPPPLSLEPERISGWEAGSALRLLLALEEEFKTSISDQEWLGIRSLEDVASIIQRRVGVARVQSSSADRPPTQLQ